MENNLSIKNSQPSRISFSVCYILRSGFGLTQTELSRLAGVSQADVSEMENHPPYGKLDKYIRVARIFGVPVDALVCNDFRFIPREGLRLPQLEYIPAPTEPNRLQGRQGEEFALRMEKERLADLWPGLVGLIIPHYKLKGASPGYDILTFDDNARPCCLEVKTGAPGTLGFRLTLHEYEIAKELTSEGYLYQIRFITDWGTERQRATDFPFDKLAEVYRITPQYYRCTPKPKAVDQISGLAYWRQYRQLRQEDISQLLGIPQCDLSLYETGSRKPSVGFYLRLAKVLDVTVEQLIGVYDTSPKREMQERFNVQ